MTNNQMDGVLDAGSIVAPLALTFQDKKFSWPHQYATGAELKTLFGLQPDEPLYLSLTDPWDDELIANDTTINLARPGVERFYIRQPLELKLEDKTYDWDKPFITGAELRQVGGVEDGDEIWLAVARPYEDERIDDTKKVDLTRPGRERFYVKKRLVVIRINNVEHQIKPGSYTVAQLKKIGNVKASDELDALKDHQLTPLDDSATVIIQGGEQFISHVRDGSSA